MTNDDIVTGSGSAIKTTRGIVWVFLALAVLAGLATLVFGVVGITSQLAAGETTLTLIADKPLDAAATTGDITIATGAFDSATLTVAGLPGYIGALAVAAHIVGTLTAASVAASVVAIAWKLLRGSVFRGSLATLVTVAGGILLLGGIVSGGLGALVSMMAVNELNGGEIDGYWPVAGVADGSTIVLGVLLMLVGLAFQYGERLQRDSDGLV